MPSPEPHVHVSGDGPPVICLHANASHGGQWRALAALLAPTHRVLAVDGYGAGRSPDWPSPDRITLADEVALLAPVLEHAGPGAVLVGHSYGAAIALRAALTHRGRVRALALYEPTLFALIEADGPPPNEADGIRAAVAAAAAALDAGDRDRAARAFIDYWMGAGAWDAMPAERRAPVAAAVTQVRRWAHALFTEPVTRAELARLDLPVLLMTGSRTTASARGASRRLQALLPQVQAVEVEGVGHMAPVTDPQRINPLIARFVASLAPT